MTGYRIAWIVFLAVPLMLALLVGELLVFHLVLQYRGMSTYDYILAQREKHNSLRSSGGLRTSKGISQISPEQPPDSNLIMANHSALANGSAVDPDGLDLEADQEADQEAHQGLHHR